MKLAGNNLSLHWLSASGMHGEEFSRIQAQLLTALANGKAEQIYTIGRRSVYQTDAPELGKIAIKESCYPSFGKRLKNRYLRKPKALNEFYVGSEFTARGGKAPEMLAAALDQGFLGIRRTLIFMQWLENATTLTDYVRAHGGHLSPQIRHKLCESLFYSASLGLAHRGHSSENVLITGNEGNPEFHVIDFSESLLHDDGFHKDSYCRDVARIARRLLGDKACDRPEVDRFINTAAAAAKEKGDAGEFERLIQELLEQRISEVNAKKRKKRYLQNS